MPVLVEACKRRERRALSWVVALCAVLAIAGEASAQPANTAPRVHDCSREAAAAARRPEISAALEAAIQTHVARFWYDIGHNRGRQAEMFFLPDGEFKSTPFYHRHGRAEVRKQMEYRDGLGGRVSRHLVTNYWFDFGAFAKTCRVEVHGVMTHFGGTGAPPLPSGPPLGVYDMTAVVERQADGSWLFAMLDHAPLFLAKENPVLTMPKF